MSKNGIRYSDEFKQQIVDLYHDGTPVREYGVATVTIYTWIKSLSSIKVSKDEAIIAKEYQSVKKCIVQLEMENEILKKATAIFAKKR